MAVENEQAAGTGEGEQSGGGRTMEDRALELGWIPPEQFKGDKTRFISAEDFVKRGESLLPILKANNRQLEGRFDDLRRQNGVLQTQINELATENDALKKGQTKNTVDSLKVKRDELADELKIARDAGNTRREAEIQGEIAEVNSQIVEGEKAATAPARKRTNGTSTGAPGYSEFIAAHPWYGTDKRKTYMANAIGEEIRAGNPNLEGKAFYDAVSVELEKEFGGNQRRTGHSKVEGGARGTSEGGGGSGDGKTYADLPQNAKDACQNQAKRLVGEGKKYKTISEWQTAYVAKYFE